MVRNASDADQRVTETFPGITIPDSTGAPGSAGIQPTESDSPLMRVRVMDAYTSEQGDPAVYASVGVGDSAGSSDDLAAHAGPAGGDAGPYTDTGAGHGTVATPPHRNAGR